MWLGAFGLAPEISSDEPIEIRENGQVMVAKGHARLSHSKFTLESDSIEFLRKDQIANAKGHVSLMNSKVRATAKEVNYSVPQKEVRAEDFRLGLPPSAFFEGTKLWGTPDNLSINDSVVYFGEPDPFTFNIKSKKMAVEDQAMLVFEDATFRIGKLPIFYLPKYRQQLVQSAARVKCDYGQSKNLGFYGRNNVLYRVTPHWKVGGLLDFYTRRGLLVGPAYEYDKSIPNNKVRSSGQAGFINDHGDRKLDSLGKPIRRSRDFLQLRHNQEICDQVDLVGSLDWWRDSEAFRDFRPREFGANQQPDNFLETVYRGKGYFFSAFTRFRPNNFQKVPERFPELRFDLVPQRLMESPLYHSFNASYVQLTEKSLTGIPKIHSNRYDAYYGLSYPIGVTDWLAFTPVTGGRVTHYANAINNRNHYTRFLGQIGFDSEIKTFAQWDYSNKIWNIRGLRHVMKPILQYRYIPKANSGSEDIPVVDKDAVPTLMSPMDLGNMRNIDDLHEMNLMRLGLENLLQTREELYGSRDLSRLNLYQDFKFSRKNTEKTLGNFYSEFGLTPIRWLDVSVYSRTEMHSKKLQEIRTQTKIFDATRWSLALSTDLYKKNFHQYNLSYQYQLTARHSLLTSVRYDANKHALTEQQYGLISKIGHSWEVQYGVTHCKDSSRENGLGFHFIFKYIGL